MTTAAGREGMAVVPGGRVWYWLTGGGDGVPLVVLHGGPGFPHDYLEPLAALSVERPLLFYDQLGCGRSERPDDPALWRVERFVQELEALLQALGLKRVHLLGHSWGSILAVEFALAWPARVVSLMLASPCLSIPRWLDDLSRYRAMLPVDVQLILNRHEAAGTFDAPAYQMATMEFYRRHLCRLDPWPPQLLRSLEGAGLPVYETMWGPNEFTITGALRAYDRTDSLAALQLPVLFTCGRYDEATPETTAFYSERLSGSRLAVFERSAHMPHLEEPDVYLSAVHGFLRSVEG